MKHFLYFIFLSCICLTSVSVSAQDFLNAADFSSLKIDNLSNTELSKIKEQLIAKNTTIDAVKPMALAKGMSETEFGKLKTRLGTQEIVSEKSDNEDSNADKKNILEKKTISNSNPLVFGTELFSNPSLTFEPSSKIATPINYILGPGDELQLSVFGVQEYNGNATISPEGKISVPFVGQIYVAGMPIEAASTKIKSAFAKIYSTVASGQSKFNVTLGKIRTINITIVGAKQTGNYSVSSLSTVYNALYLAGGPNENGSYRNIELIRNNKLVRVIDIYKFLLYGDQSDNLGLKEGDLIRIPTYLTRVTIEGEVKRPGIFELKKGDTFQDLVIYASNFTENAFTAKINILQKTNKEFKIIDIVESEFKTFQPKYGDIIRIGKILNKFENRIKIEGTVFRPDTYSFTIGMRVSDLVKKAEGIKEDAYTNRARIVRVKSDLTSELITINLEKALAGDKQYDIELKKEDVLTIYSILDFKEEYKISIYGEINKQGEYSFYENLTLNDLLIQAGGLTGSASKKIEIARMIKSENINELDPKKIELIEINITPENNEQLENLKLQPFDVINIRRLPVFEKPNFVYINGYVLYPGRYVLANKKDKIFDIIQRAGGFLSTSNLEGIKILRPIKNQQIDDLKNINQNINLGDDSKLVSKLKNEVKNAVIPINWKKIVTNTNSFENITLQEGDVIEVPIYNDVVRVAGNVLLTSEIPFKQGKGFNYYINAVGGVDSKALKRNSYIIYPNGQASVTKRIMFTNYYPKVKPGSQIIVPERLEVKKGVSTTDVLAVSTVVASLAGVIFGILNATK